MHTNPLLLDFEDKSLQQFFYCSNQPMWIVDSQLQSVLETNQAVTKTYGYPKDEIVLQLVEKFIPSKEKNKLFELADASFKAQKTLRKEFSVVGLTGKVFYAEVMVSGIIFQGKEARLLTMTDITDKKIYRSLLEESIDTELGLTLKIWELKSIAYFNFHLARKPLANILGLVNVMDQSVIDRKTLTEALEFLRESGNELDDLIKKIDPQEF